MGKEMLDNILGNNMSDCMKDKVENVFVQISKLKLWMSDQK